MILHPYKAVFFKIHEPQYLKLNISTISPNLMIKKKKKKAVDQNQ